VVNEPVNGGGGYPETGQSTGNRNPKRGGGPHDSSVRGEGTHEIHKKKKYLSKTPGGGGGGRLNTEKKKKKNNQKKTNKKTKNLSAHN